MIARVWRGVVRAEDIERAVYYPEDDRYLLERDPRVMHYQVPDQQ